MSGGTGELVNVQILLGRGQEESKRGYGEEIRLLGGECFTSFSG